MKRRSFVCLIIAFSLMFSSITQAYAAYSTHDHHDHAMSDAEHASLDFDSEGNPHKSADHFHLNSHIHFDIGSYTHGSDSIIERSTLEMEHSWKQGFYSDLNTPPLLDPPLSA